MKTRFASFFLIVLALLLALPQPGQPPVASAAAPAVAGVRALPAPRLGRQLSDVIVTDPPYTMYLPLIKKPMDCTTGQSYSGFSPSGGYDGIPAAQHPDKNLALRGYDIVNGRFTLGFVQYSGNHDAAAPKLQTLLKRTPTFTHIYQVYDWNWGGSGTYGARGSRIDPPTCPAGSCWDVTALGFQTNLGELVYLPLSGYGDIAGGTYYALVLYATASSITLKYTSEDSVVSGYTLHVDNVCVDPNLVALYNTYNANGRHPLPALTKQQAFGRATSGEINVVIRDNGSFMDPRSQQDWWLP